MKSNNPDLAVVISGAIFIWFWTIILGISIDITRQFIDSVFNVNPVGSVFLIVIPLVAIGLYFFYKVFRGLLQTLPLVLQLLLRLLTGLLEQDREKNVSNISESDEDALHSKIEKFPTQMMDIFRNVIFLFVLALIIRFLLSVFQGLGFARY